MNLTKLRKWKPNPLAVAFFIPFLLLLILMITQEVTPFGNKMMLYSDEWHQYFPFFKAFREAIRNGNSLLYSWDVGMGMDYLGLISYYLASPLNLISVILPDQMVLPYFTMLLPIKLSLASLFFAIFLKKLFGKNDYSIAVFGSFYALCAWALGYQWNIMWLDTFALLPLVALGTVYLLRDRKVVLYTVSLALSIFANYYIGFFTCIFVLLVFICYQICRCKSVSRFFMDFARIAVFSVLAIAMTAMLTLPAWAALSKTYSSVNAFPDSFYLNIVEYEVYSIAREAWNAYKTAKEAGEPTFLLWCTAFWKSIFPVWEGMKTAAGNMSGGLKPSFMEGLPNVYTGVSTLYLSFLFLMANRVKVRDKVCSVLLMLFLLASCVVRELDYIWHGFHFPNMIPHRFSFILSFVMLYMAYRAYLVRNRFKPVHLLFAGFLTVEVFMLSGQMESIKEIWNSVGEFFPALIRGIVYIIGGNAEAAETAISYAQGLYTNYSAGYIFLLFNGGFLALYGAILLVSRLRPKMPVGITWQERKNIVQSNLKHRRLCTVLLLVVMSFELIANVASFERNYSYTSTTDYPHGTEYTESMIRYMKEREDSLFYRAETTRTQTLNDGALNGYYGISTFTSSANVNTTRFLTALGLASQDNWNRYSYEETSPVANLFFNLKYLIERDGQLEENPYFDNVLHYGNVYLLENNAYLPLGFLSQSELGNAQMVMESTNSFSNQNILFAAATGIETPVWDMVPADWLNVTGENAQITYNDGAGHCYYSVSGGSGSLIYTYTIQKEGFLCLDVSMTSRNNFTIYRNNEYVFSESVILPQTMSVCQVHPGDVIELRASCPDGEVSDMYIQAALLNDTVFREGYEILNASTLELTEFETDRIVGVIDCNRDGLLYTSIPNDGNWVAYVDGEKTEIVSVGGAMVAVPMTTGEHTVKFVYRNRDFVFGNLITVSAFIAFMGLAYVYNRKRVNACMIRLYGKGKELCQKLKK